MSSDEPTDQSIERLLLLLEKQATTSSEARSAARVRMQEAYIAARSDRPDAPEPDGEIELVRIVTEDHSQGSSMRWLRPSLTAAAIVLISLAGLFVANSRSTPSIDTATRDGRLIAESTGPLPARLQSGTYTTTALGTALTFGIDEPVWLIVEEPGWIELAVDPDDQPGRLILSRPTDAPAQLGGTMIDWVSAAESVTFQRSRAVVGGQPTNVWSIFVSDQAIADGNCEIGDSCVGLLARPQDIGFRAGGSNDLLEIEQGPYEPIYVITWRSPERTQAELGGYASIADSISFGDLRPSPLN